MYRMTKEITTSPFETLPVVVFQRLHVDTKEPISLHAIIFQCADDAREKANWIRAQNHLALVGATDATFAR